MLSKLSIRKSKHLLARVASKCAPCAFCRREVDDEVIYGKLYVIGDIHVHYFCVLLSCCLIQKGKDEEGLFGFLYPDILEEIKRSKNHRCSYCNKEGATLGCSISQCRKQFHLPCGREKNAISMFHGNYKSFCWKHAPKQKVASNILDNIKERKIKERKLKAIVGKEEMKSEDIQQDMVCVICYEKVDAFPSLLTFWPPCCARDAWFHRSCLQRMALSAGMHYLKCPLCNDKEQFYNAVMSQGYYIPDRDAAWELEQNAFAEIYERKIVCNVPECKCPQGREYDVDNGPWDIKLCLLCGSVGAHAQCADIHTNLYVCAVCEPAAPSDVEYLEAIDRLSLPDPNQNMSRSRQGPRMPSRMSLRRTKPKLFVNNMPSSSNVNQEKVQANDQTSENTLTSRSELNLKPPRRRIFEPYYKNLENKLQSPIKLLEKKLCEKLEDIETLDSLAWNSSEVIDVIKEKIRKPRPLAVKKKIVNSVIDNVLNNILKERTKIKEPVKEWISPKKSCDITDAVSQKMEVDLIQDIKKEHGNTQENPIICQNFTNMSHKNNIENEKHMDTSNILTEEFLDKNLPIISPKSKPVIVNTDSAIEISKNDQKLDINVVKIAPSDKDKIVPLKFSPRKEIAGKNIDIDVESFKNQYLNEVTNKNKTDSKHTVEEKSKNRSKIRKTKDKRREKNKSVKSKIKKRYVTDKVKSKSNINLVFDMSENVASKKSKKEVSRRKRRETELSIRDKNIHVNIKWKKEQLKLKITKSKEERKVLKQYVLNYPENSQSGVLLKPDTEISPIRKK
ncbi:unnamed protein product [Colias eurytheme]|nr:unnamed protein product [Colias eurytheme]